MTNGQFDGSFQRIAGFRRVKSKASGRALGGEGAPMQVSLHEHLREHGQPKTESTGSPHESLFALLVLWLGDRVYLTLRRTSDGHAFEAIGATEAEAWKIIERQLELLGI